MSIEDLLKNDEVHLSLVISHVLVVKREECEGKLKIHIASPVNIYDFGKFNEFFNNFVRCCSDVMCQHNPYVTDHKNVMFGSLCLKINDQDVKIIVYPDSEIANWAISNKNEICIPYSSFVPSDFWSQLQAAFI